MATKLTVFLVRLVSTAGYVQNDPGQSALATSLFASLTTDQRGHVSPMLLVETFWVLSRGYKLPTKEVVTALDGVRRGCEYTVTFDRKGPHGSLSSSVEDVDVHVV